MKFLFLLGITLFLMGCLYENPVTTGNKVTTMEPQSHDHHHSKAHHHHGKHKNRFCKRSRRVRRMNDCQIRCENRYNRGRKLDRCYDRCDDDDRYCRLRRGRL